MWHMFLSSLTFDCVCLWGYIIHCWFTVGNGHVISLLHLVLFAFLGTRPWGMRQVSGEGKHGEDDHKESCKIFFLFAIL
jgi:hypothetical protein